MNEVQLIAAALSVAQRSAIIRATGSPVAYIPLYRDMGRTAASLRDLKLARLANKGTALTPLGKRVRAELVAADASVKMQPCDVQ